MLQADGKMDSATTVLHLWYEITEVISPIYAGDPLLKRERPTG